jgi:hypothetical protein
MANGLVDSIKKVNELNYLSNDYKLPKSEFKKILANYKKNKKINISEELEEFIIFVNGKMFYDWVVFKSINNVPVFNEKIGDLGLFYSLKKDTQYYSFGVMESNNDIIGEKEFVFAEATPGDFLIISFDEKDYGKIYFISHDTNEKEEYKYLVADTMENLIKNMYIKEN